MGYMRETLGVPMQPAAVAPVRTSSSMALPVPAVNVHPDNPVSSLPPDDLSHQLSPAALWSSRQNMPPGSNPGLRPQVPGASKPQHMTQETARQLLAQFGDMAQPGLAAGRLQANGTLHAHDAGNFSCLGCHRPGHALHSRWTRLHATGSSFEPPEICCCLR